MTAKVFLTKKTKQLAAQMRDESLEKLKATISDVDISKQCCDYFRNDVNKIIAETEEEVKKFLATLRDASICVGITIGAIVAAVVTPPAILISPAAAVVGAGAVASAFRTIRSGVRVANLHNPEDTSAENTEDKLELKIYDGCKIDVELCFGKVSISLRSSIKLHEN